MFQWLNRTGGIRCPRCERGCEYCDTEWNTCDPIAYGSARCDNCVTPAAFNISLMGSEGSSFAEPPSLGTIPLTFEWEYDILTGQVKTRGHGFERQYDIEPHFGGHLQQQSTPESTAMQVFVIRRRDARNVIVDVLTTQRQAEREYGDRSSLEILPYECEHTMIDGTYQVAFMVWIVTVGKGDSTRIVGVYTTKKDAAKVASPVQGRIRELEAVPRKRVVRSIAVYKSFVSMRDAPSEYDRSQLVDRVSVRRKLYDGEEEIMFPVATFKRRYSSSLPHRIEILATSEQQAKDIARQFGQMEDAEISEMLEYNVDYRLLREANEWRFDPCLLNQPV